MKKHLGKNGFTVIEVVLVMAIAGLIFMAIFLTLPALQRMARDNERRLAVDHVLAQLDVFKGNIGHYPSDAGERVQFRNNYPITFSEPLTGDSYDIQYSSALFFSHIHVPVLGEILYVTGHWCAEPDAPTTVDGIDHVLSQVAVVGYLESAGIYCVDNS